MEDQQTTKPYILALAHSLGVVIYVGLVALLMQNAENLFGNPDGIIGIVAFLLLFTVSAAVVGSLIFARPVLMALNGDKKEAIQFVSCTIGFLIVEAAIIFVVLALT